ncbi:unnamed protein product [Candida verbasci]|uniref:Cysteine protease RIM13 n=1 Tax=Candida verbasci TaxID=1227364 RepID=A0A9W4TZ06_9ASCO|nr:unnamed protein product [Candida verbasci]
MNQFLNYIDETFINLSIDNNQQAKNNCLKAIKLLNGLVKDTKYLKCLSEFTLKLYKLKLSTSEKLAWLSSKNYHPIVDFGEVTSHNEIFIGSVNDEMMPMPDLPIDYKPINIDSWDTDLKDIYQDILPNCSFVSSFLALNDKFRLIDLITPHHPSSSFFVKLNFNGGERIVKIDNKLPIIKDSMRNLIIKSLSSDIYWPALIEKAYLKVMGNSYKFEGSNMANDTYMLSGYIPEIIQIKNGLLDLPYLKSVDAVLGIGTRKLSSQLASQLNLISEHDYVIEKFNDDGSIDIKNPWSIDNRTNTIHDFTHFRFIYINWKKTLPFKTHFINTSTQFKVKGWILLEKHLPVENNWMSITIYDSKFKVLTENEYKKINYIDTNNRLQLIKLPKTCTIKINSNQNGIFTLSSGYEIEKSKYEYRHTSELSGEWNSQTNGGNWSMSTYIDNPQYKMEVKEPTNLKIALHSKGLVNLHLFHGGGKIETFTKPIINENYNQDYQLGTFQLSKGSYTLVVSRYDKSIESFRLIFNSSSEINIFKHSNYLGLFNKTVEFDWDNKNRYKYVFTLTDPTSIKFRINYFNLNNSFEIHSNYRPGLRASLFKDKQPILINKEFNDSLFGIFLTCDLSPGAYILLVERFEIGYGSCKIFIGSNKKIK